MPDAAGITAIDGSGFPVIGRVVPRVVIPTAIEVARRSDAVREAAREFEDLSDQDVKERLKGTTSRQLSPAEISGFRDDVRRQVLDDLIDVLDQGHRGVLRRRRTVRLSAPRGYRVKATNGLSADELAEVRERLSARGWSMMELDGAGLRVKA